MARPKKKLITSKLKIIPLGGLSEIGKNMTVIEYEDDIIIIDCGMGFPDEDMLGIDFVIPDITYLENNVEKVRGIFLTHGHEDHIGALPYVLQVLDVPVYGTSLTLGIVENKLSEHSLENVPQLINVSAGDVITAGCFDVEFIRVNHSIADACALAIYTPAGTVFHTGDFKLDITPVESEMMDITRIGEIGKEGVLLLMCESTNVEEPGFTPSESYVGKSLDGIFMRNKDKRIIIATFSSNVHRVQQIINTSIDYNRRVAITGRSMLNIVKAAVELGYMNVPDGLLIDINEVNRYPHEQITVISTGSQGEPMSALYRMAFGEHDKISIGSRDLVVISAHAIPGNEKLVGKIINELYNSGASVFHDSVVDVHVSGHACQEELKLMYALTKPKFAMPVHGEYRHLSCHRELAESMGLSPDNIFVSDIGKVLELTPETAKFNGTVPSGRVLVDGLGVGDVGNIVLRDRKHLSKDGIMIVVVTVDLEAGLVISGPEVISRGFVYVREAEELIDEIRNIALDLLEYDLDDGIRDYVILKNDMKDGLAKYLFNKTHRKPMILPVLMNV